MTRAHYKTGIMWWIRLSPTEWQQTHIYNS